MTSSIREQVVAAIFTLSAAALPSWLVVREVDAAEARAANPTGDLIVRDGEPGQGVRDLGVSRYYYEHTIPLDLMVGDQPDLGRDQYLDQSLVILGAAIAANRTLAGLIDYLDMGSVAPDDLLTTGAAPLRCVTIDLVASYWSPTPLG